MIEVRSGLDIGTDRDCCQGTTDLAVVHACKNPCHTSAVGYRGSLPTTHPNYLSFENGYDLALNMIDPPIPLFMPEMFAVFLDFCARQHAEARPILIHCNQGESRAPSLALVYLAKIAGEISNESYEAARGDFIGLFDGYFPGVGIQRYLTDHWTTLGKS